MLGLLFYVFVWLVSATVLHVVFEVIRAHDKYSVIPPPTEYKFLGAFCVAGFWPLLLLGAMFVAPYLLWRFVMSKISLLIEEGFKSAD